MSAFRSNRLDVAARPAVPMSHPGFDAPSPGGPRTPTRPSRATWSGSARLAGRALAAPVRLLRRWRDEGEMLRYLRSASRSELADFQAMGMQMPWPASSQDPFEPSNAHWRW